MAKATPPPMKKPAKPAPPPKKPAKAAAPKRPAAAKKPAAKNSHWMWDMMYFGKSGGPWRDYDTKTNSAIIAAIHAKKKVVQVDIDGWAYMIDLERQIQTNKRSKHTRRIRCSVGVH